MMIQELYDGVGFSYLITVAGRGRQQQKLEKALDYGFLAAGMHLAPWTQSGRNVCAFASKLCRKFCITWSGPGGIGLAKYGMNDVQHARIARTNLFFNNPERFWEIFHYEMGRFLNKARKLKLLPVFRPNITSDILWEKHKTGSSRKSKSMFEEYPLVQFMDYTAIPLHLRKGRPDNYHLTFSLKEDNHDEAHDVMRKGLANVAVVFEKLPYGKRRRSHNVQGTMSDLPKEWSGYPVIDGDVNDLRFLDKPGHIVALRAKGNRIKGNADGFIFDPYLPYSLAQHKLMMTGT